MEKSLLEIYSRNTIHDIFSSRPLTLIVVSDEENRVMLFEEVDMSLFHVPVHMTVLSLQERTLQKLLDNINSTKKVLKTWNQQQKS